MAQLYCKARTVVACVIALVKQRNDFFPTFDKSEKSDDKEMESTLHFSYTGIFYTLIILRIILYCLASAEIINSDYVY